jgi:hypothetical protein
LILIFLNSPSLLSKYLAANSELFEINIKEKQAMLVMAFVNFE